MRDFLTVAKALSDSNRVRALAALRHHELCVCQVVELLKLAPSTVSKHLSVLKQAYLVESYKNGRWVYYRRPQHNIPPPVRDALNWVDAAVVRDPAVRDDAKRMKEILKIPVEELCKVSEGS